MSSSSSSHDPGSSRDPGGPISTESTGIAEAISDDPQAAHRGPDLARLDEVHCLACELVPADLRQAQLGARTRLPEHSSFDVDTGKATARPNQHLVDRNREAIHDDLQAVHRRPHLARLERWWGPPNYPATVVDHDLTDGGRVNYYMTAPDGERLHGWWRIISVDSPRSLEFEEGCGPPNEDLPATTAQVRLVGTADKTTMTIITRFASIADMEQLLGMGKGEGTRLAVGEIDAILVTAVREHLPIESAKLWGAGRFGGLCRLA
jgi:uncharacterized protein YndB with AHSA1/START domain